MRLKIFLLFFCVSPFFKNIDAQIILSGTVFDSSKINIVPNVIVISNKGNFTTTDSAGKYSLTVNEADSISYFFRNKYTQKFAIRSIADPEHFNISLKVPYKGKYSTLKEVVVFSKSYRQDSIENREEYAKVYNYKKPGLYTTISPSGATGADLDEIINMFRFKRNKELKDFQNRLLLQEQDNYINNRFNKILIKRITQLHAEQLDAFMVKYRPAYSFLINANEMALNQYILNCSYNFKKELSKATVPSQKK